MSINCSPGAWVGGGGGEVWTKHFANAITFDRSLEKAGERSCIDKTVP